MQDKKLRVLIVDDEFRIGMLIKKLIKWDDVGLECVNVVDNGETAYSIILEEKPDIVITDIRMPKISGLDLISMTKEKNEQVKFVVISGYKEFEYAHKALQYGVTDYLLKPINEDELDKVLRKLQAAITDECIKQQQGEQFKKAVTASEQIIKSNLLNSIIDKAETHTVDEIEEEYNVHLNAGAYIGIDIKLDYWDYEKNSKRQDKLTVEKITVIVEKNFKDYVKEYLICEKANLNIYCLINYDLSKSREIKNIINSILTEIQAYLIGFEQYKVTIGIGSEETDFGNIGHSISEAYKAVQNRIKFGTGRLIYADLLQPSELLDIQKYLSAYKGPFLTGIESFSKESVEKIVSQIFDEFQFKENIDFSCLYDIADELIDLFFENFTVHDNEKNQYMQFMKSACQQCYKLFSLKGLLKDNFGKYMDICLNLLETEATKPIRQAKQYIDEHYSEKIVLEDIAAIVNLNPVYFSVLFKRKTGLNFSAYLVNVRIEVAKEMIRNSNKTIAAIADEVGYKDTRYFSQIFTKTVGIKPALYRKIYS